MGSPYARNPASCLSWLLIPERLHAYTATAENSPIGAPGYAGAISSWWVQQGQTSAATVFLKPMVGERWEPLDPSGSVPAAEPWKLSRFCQSSLSFVERQCPPPLGALCAVRSIERRRSPSHLRWRLRWPLSSGSGSKASSASSQSSEVLSCFTDSTHHDVRVGSRRRPRVIAAAVAEAALGMVLVRLYGRVPAGGSPRSWRLRRQPRPPASHGAGPPGFRKDVTPLISTPGGLMEQSNASLQRGCQS